MGTILTNAGRVAIKLVAPLEKIKPKPLALLPNVPVP